MANRTPEDVAQELGLKFKVEATPDGKWKRFRFDFEGYEKVPTDNTVGFRAPPPDYEAPKNLIATIQAVTRWREKIKPWLFLGTTDTVAAELTMWTRAVVFKFNRGNAKRMRAAAKALEGSEAYGRQLAISQPTPRQALRIIDELTKNAEPETQALRIQLENAAVQADALIATAKLHAEGRCGCPVDLCAVGLAEKNAPMADVVSLDERRKAAG